ELLRVYEVLFNRHGRPAGDERQRVLARLDPLFPGPGRYVNGELCQLLVYLEAPGVTTRALRLIEDAPTQEEQIESVRAVRALRDGWTRGQRRESCGWFKKAAGYRGGASFGGFLKIMRDDAVATLTDAEKAELKPLLEARLEGAPPTPAKPRPFVKK